MKRDHFIRMTKYVLSVLIFLLFNSNAVADSAATDLFPVYPCIKPNVNFWIKIYTRYDVTDGVLHDSQDLSVIYGIIPLLDPQSPGAGKINEKRIKDVKDRYHNMLTRLAHSPAPRSAEEKRIVALFGENASSVTYLRASDQLRCQVGQKSRFLAGLFRSGAYLDEFREILVSRGLPGDLLYLAHVESSFDPHATSKCGAAGIWQFMPATARRFMKVNSIVDERRDPFISTTAAAAYLKENMEILKSWPLAVTAYNHGANSMLRAKKQKGTFERIFREYQSPAFGFASRNFYPSFLAAREIASNHEQYFGKIELARPVPTVIMVVPENASLTRVSRNLGLSPETIRELNPALRPAVYAGLKYLPRGYGLKIPAAMLAQLPADVLQNQEPPARIHVVRKGETAYRISRMHRVSLSDLIAINNLSSQATIHPGQSLTIPN